jgi:hypothetical protein
MLFAQRIIAAKRGPAMAKNRCHARRIGLAEKQSEQEQQEGG